MEKIDLKKFEDYKLDKRQLSYIHAGEGNTGAGTNIERHFLNRHIYTYDSDYINSSGGIIYINYQYSHSLSSHSKRFIVPSLLE